MLDLSKPAGTARVDLSCLVPIPVAQPELSACLVPCAGLDKKKPLNSNDRPEACLYLSLAVYTGQRA
jgi:hypothetical protein